MFAGKARMMRAMRVATTFCLLALFSTATFACAAGEAAPQTPQTTATVDLTPHKPEAELSPEEAAREQAKNAGILGVLNAETSDAADVFGTGALGTDLDGASALGGLVGTEAGNGYGGLGLRGTGRGGGGTGEGTIGLGTLGAIGKGGGTGAGQGFGSGSGRLGGSRRETPPKVKTGSSEVTGSLPKEVIQRVVRQSLGKLLHCYETGLQKDPKLAGKVTTKFTISPKGTVSTARSESDLSDAEVGRCVEKTFRSMVFPEPDKGGIVVVSYPVVFTPGEPPPSGGGAGSPAPSNEPKK